MTERNIDLDELNQYLEDTEQILFLAQKLAGIDAGTGEPCPFCGGDNRFYYGIASRKFYCRNCMPGGIGYSIYDLIMRFHGVDFPEALKMVAVESGFLDNEPPSERTNFTHPKTKPKKKMELQTFDLNENAEAFKKVHEHRPEIDLATYQKSGALGYINLNGGGIVVPMFDNAGYYSGYIQYSVDGSKKNSAGSKSGIVGTDARDALLSQRQVKKVFKCAGVSDYLILSQLIVKAGLEAEYYAFTNGAGEMENPGKFDPILCPALEGQTVVILQDNDEAGEKGAMKWAKHLATYAADVRIVQPPKELNGKSIKDFRDFAANVDANDVFHWINNAFDNAESVIPDTVTTQDQSESSKQGKSGKHSQKRAHPIMIRLSDVKEKMIEWLWENKIPLGMLSLIAGLAGVGKSFLTVYLTAIITNGWNWPDGRPCEKGTVIYFYGEDGIADTYKMRCTANGVNHDNVFFIQGKEINENGKVSEHDVTLHDVVIIEKAIKEAGEKTGLPVKMIVIDPISNYWGGVKENSNAEVRSVLKPLQHLAEKTGVALVLIQHLGKGDKEHTQQQVLGSTGIVASCRSVWGVFVAPEDKGKRIFAPLKVNCGFNHTAVSYKIMPPDGGVEIIENSIENLTGDDITHAQRQAKNKPGRPAKEKVACVGWLVQILKDGDRLASEIDELSKEEGFGKSTINEAKKMLGIESVRDGKKRLWHLSSDSDVENTD